eukprot:TRINITY_DN1206_c1_g1_i1.p1 TRINITY_DN1206_c1_g1~~TRINITY_DN1206_c1_g1_i1.p1  ORF type:complete len:658 (+),score=159.19 TRINITY_DN1206_c1_g1_i1:152-2125(+)
MSRPSGHSAAVAAAGGALLLLAAAFGAKRAAGYARRGTAYRLAPARDAAAPLRGQQPQQQQDRLWWLAWFALGRNASGRAAAGAVVGGRLDAEAAGRLRAHFAPTELHLFATDAGPAANVRALAGDCSSKDSAAAASAQRPDGGFDFVLDLGDGADPAAQVVRWRACFAPLLRRGGSWVCERAGRVYGHPSVPLDPRRSILAAARLSIDQINRRYWDPSRSVSLLPESGIEVVQTVFFAEDLVVFSRKGLWGDSWDTLPYLMGIATRRDPQEYSRSRDVDSVSGTHGQLPSWKYHSGGPSWRDMVYANPQCAADESGFGVPPTACTAAAAETLAAAAAAQGVAEKPVIGAPPVLPLMDKMSKSEKLGGSSMEKVEQLSQGYDRWYQWYMDPYRLRQIRLLEIGLAGGQSALMWRRYFPSLELYGMDYTLQYFANQSVEVSGGINIFKGDQGNPEHLSAMSKQFGGLMDIIVDDGGHTPSAQIHTFKVLFRELLRPGGLFIIEDIEGSYAGRHKYYGDRLMGGLGKRGTAVELSKLFIDTLNRAFWDPGREHCVLETGADVQIESVFYAENVIIMTKKGGQRPASPADTSQVQPPEPPPAAEADPPAQMSGRTWDGGWELPRPQCSATASKPGPKEPTYAEFMPPAPRGGGRRYARRR